MDLIPPSYKSATDRDAWAIIAHYIPSSDLCAASLVCHRWHDLFMPFLWGDPASHFGTENDAVYVALTRFRRTLKYARPEVRALTHTLHLPPALSEIYGGPRPGWLRDILEYLPCLQSLMVSKLPFFDHNAMKALKSQPRSAQYSVRLLLADREPNTTSSSLAETLLRFPLLAYLDLSYTTSARDRGVLSTFSELEHLQVLKLCGLGLKDSDAEFLANAIGVRVRCLDLRKNLLTDMAVRSLLQASFMSPGNAGLPQPVRNRGSSPDGLRQSAIRDPDSDFFKRPDLDDHLMKQLAQPATTHTWVEDLPPMGITHLYIADNPISVEGVASLLASSRLHVLDVGTVNTADALHKAPALKTERYPGAEKLVPILGKIAGDHLTYFRVHHAVLTAEPPNKDAASTTDFLPELQSSEVTREAELDASQEIPELPGRVQPVYELPDTSITQDSGSTNTRTQVPRLTMPLEDEQLPAVRRGSAFAPEVVQPIPQRGDSGGGRAPDATGATVSKALQSEEGNALPCDTSHANSSLEPIPICGSPISTDDPRAQRIQELLAKRPRSQSIPLLGGKESRFPYLHPSHVPHLETLILTDVPSHVAPNSLVLSTLLRFITACSNEALLATLQAGSDYSLPPGQARIRAEQQRSRSLFGLRRLVIEITPVDQSSRLTPWKAANENSSTGDPDSENLWAAATHDFSFFGEDECGVPENDTSKYFPMAVLNEKVSLMPSDDDSNHSGADTPLQGCHRSRQSVTSAASGTPSPPQTVGESQPSAQVPDVDLVAELAAFRRAKKAEYERVVRRERGRRSTNGTGVSSLAPSMPQIFLAHFVEGHWKGEVKIVRNPTPKVRSGTVDMYGNYFEKGYLYP
ncbi:hypothetical protein NUU61_009064 [Penicillium alfredii]|uniref:F-box domain-containing protein n=1 Tax=Penicillium alfredii TaxID=1506179 RepID=A0A9W9EMI2_9EURO|nr:uncharacterized protein NUU61_009064 [Penicillium alfredii]KAJ5084485.1 hypothetical protein NUU61_009064 [Penicillium alfredii]